jgi:hypothetical protein
MMGGREIPTFTRTCAIAGAGNTMTNAKNNAPIINFFILISPLHIISFVFHYPCMISATSGAITSTGATPSS